MNWYEQLPELCPPVDAVPCEGTSSYGCCGYDVRFVTVADNGIVAVCDFGVVEVIDGVE